MNQTHHRASRRRSFGAQAARRDGFTFIEMLVVVGIIVTLVSILMPWVASSREAARRAVCQSNLHQIYVALGVYFNDFKSLPDQPTDPLSPSLTALMVAELPGSRRRPVGLGLLYPVHISDARIFYCPSSNVRPRDAMKAWDDIEIHGDHGAGDGWGADQGPGKGKGKGWTVLIPLAVSSYVYRGLYAMTGFENPLNKTAFPAGSGTGMVMDDNTGDLKRIWGTQATANWDFYKHKREGGNVVYGDGSVRWTPDPLRLTYVPATALNDPTQYTRIWNWID
ncbi:MAG: type II secretion system protein, partial [Planctomycetes bacterium]|nr:type II secretion system protein [Planctomycetota bacterium]